MKIGLSEHRGIPTPCLEFLLLNKNTNLTINLFPRPFPNAVRISSKLSRIEQTTIKKKKEEKKKQIEQQQQADAPPPKQTALFCRSSQPHRSQRRLKRPRTNSSKDSVSERRLSSQPNPAQALSALVSQAPYHHIHSVSFNELWLFGCQKLSFLARLRCLEDLSQLKTEGQKCKKSPCSFQQ